MNAACKKWIDEKLKKLHSIESYCIGESTETLAKQLGISPAEILKLNFNENLFMPRAKLIELMKEVAEKCDLRIYPQEEEYKLREKLSDYLKTPKENIVVGNASDELIDRIARFFLDKGESAVSVMPTFPVFKYCAKRQGAEYVTVPLLDNFGLDMERLLSTFSSKTRILYLCSPNNPTGNQFSMNEVETLAKKLPGIAILDEAYAEYADYSMVSHIGEFENLIILRTFSKAFGLAALRLGYAVTSPRLAKTLSDKTPLPFPVSAFTLNMGQKLLENVEVMKKAVEELKSERGKLIRKLDEIKGIEAFDSKANFVLFNVHKAPDEVYQSLLKRGLLIKKLGKILHLDNCLRTTVGLPHMNARLLEALREISR
ncbi:MAG: histidinol-phosphate transaminase [Candidatus Bathyarchaeota archaeon]|nr:MAG: histidinol-phosphate transaminase [Candidatus Bathyarchaeota archaeon]